MKKNIKKAGKLLMIMVVIISLIAINNNNYNKAVEKCVSKGNDISYCENGLK